MEEFKITDKEKAKKATVLARLSDGTHVRVPLVGYKEILDEMEKKIKEKRA